MHSQDITLVTNDNVKIAGRYIPGSLSLGIVLLHMMPATKESYEALAEGLSRKGFHTLAIDLRGHGASEGGDYKSFTDEQHQASIKDIEAAVEYLRKQNPVIEIGLVGASIGANLACQYAAANTTAFVVLLSAGLDYRGVKAAEFVQKMPESLPIYFISARNDARVADNAMMTENMYNACNSKRKFITIFTNGGHGTEMLNTNKDLQENLIDWIKNNGIK